MTPPRRRGRRIPPKGTGQRPAQMPPAAPGSGMASATSGMGAGSGTDPSLGADPAAGATSTDAARRTRAQNRAAKRAASGVRPKAVRGGRVTGRQSRGYNPALLGLAIAAVLVVAAVFLLGNPFGGASPSPSAGTSATPVASRSMANCPTSAPSGLAAGETRTVTIETSKGNILIYVAADLAPVAAANFVALATCGFYDGVVFHRVVPDFVIQAGDGQYGWIGALDTTQVGQGGPGYQFADEPVIGEYTRGTVAMANSGANTNGSQFFICTADLTSRLPKDYTIFGHVTSGMDVVDQIVSAPRNDQDYPDDPVAMDRVTVAAGAAPSASPSAAPATSPGASAMP
jgi:cyclophilin family peptidyl-prolyl cis-trans isomerase